jgi:hypothetical protein
MTLPSQHDNPRESNHTLSAAVPSSPEDRQIFRLAQLTLLVEAAGVESIPVPTVDRLGFYDFFAANPFIVVSADNERDAADRLTLRLAGFSDRQLSYASTGQRFASRLRRLQYDLSLLIAYGVVVIDSSGYTLTSRGREVAAELVSVYAEAYRDAAGVILRRLRRLTDTQLTQQAEQWLGQSWLLIDVLDDVAETTPEVINNERSRGRRRDQR